MKFIGFILFLLFSAQFVKSDPDAPYNPRITAPIKKTINRAPQDEKRKSRKKNVVPKLKKSKLLEDEKEESEIPHDFD